MKAQSSTDTMSIDERHIAKSGWVSNSS